jgi:peptidoglycan-associated lipoprotein
MKRPWAIASAVVLSAGVADGRLTTISYGEERPLDPGHDEEAWGKNRRAVFVLQ